tara:strand:- start:5139 stop:5816 length:678 start_codon:yes stop_codon:yes gene_type:complete
MNTVEKIRKALGLPQTKLYAEARLDDGRVVVTEAESMDVGVEVRILDDSGEASLIDAGTYTLEDGTKIVVNEDSRLASLGDDEVEVEVELEESPNEKDDEDEMGYEKKKVDMNYDKVRDALDQGFPDLGQDTIDAIATLVATIYSNDEEVVEVVAEEEEDDREDMSKFLEEAFASISERLNALEDAPASKGVTHSPNNFSATHKPKDLKQLNSVERALHNIISNK